VAVRAHSTAAEAAEEEPAKKPRRALRERKAAIELTDAAVARIKTLLEGKPNAKGVLLGVRRRGCNGLSYTLNYAEKVGKLDDVVEKGGVTVVIDPKALMHLIGTVMDYQEDEISAEFKFINPNAKGSCGCGESFST
jgi:iron-sulfur cluster assembly accessory protein